jgi:hypothetical protein
VDTVRVSLWAGSREEYERNYHGTGADVLARVIGGLRRLSAACMASVGRSPRLILHEPLNRYNMLGLPGFLELAAATGSLALSTKPTAGRLCAISKGTPCEGGIVNQARQWL